MAHKSPCPQCSQTGLPILFTRYAAAYSATQAGLDALDALKPAGNLQSKPSGVAIKTAKTNVRMLRAGFLYIRIESKIRQPEWQAYAVHAHGYLTRIQDLNNPQDTPAEPACKPNEWGANRCLVWIGDAENVTKLHHIVHPDPIEPDHLKKVIDPAPDRFMQSFKVADWLKGSTSQNDTMLPDSLDIMVMEFKALKDTTVQKVGCEQHYGLMGTPEERVWGTHTEVKHGPHTSEGYRTDNTSPDPDDRYTIGTGGVGPTHTGTYLHEYVDLPYERAHGPRLKGIVDFLKQAKGAVVACEDPIGVAQELGLHHLTAAIPYVAWLKEVDGTDARNPKVTNEWKQAASETIKTMEDALHKRAMGLYDKTTEELKAHRAELERMRDVAPLEKLERQPDGTFKKVSGQDYYTNLLKKVDARIADREKSRDVVDANEAATAIAKTQAHYSEDKRHKFDALHAKQIKERDDAMDKLTEDLISCICHKSFYEQTLGRYRRDQRGIDTGDGVRCAAQLCAVLTPMDSSPRGRKWYASLDLFNPEPQNVVWRMVSLNNEEITKELQAAMGSLTNTLPAASIGDAAISVDENLRRQRAYTDMIAALGRAPKSIKAGQSILDNAKQALSRSATLMQRFRAAQQIVKTAEENIHSVWCAAVVQFLHKYPVTEWERKLASAQLVSLATSLGQNAADLVNKEKQLELGKIKASGNYEGNKSPSRASRNLNRDMQRTAEKFDERTQRWISGSADKLALGRRLPGVLAGIEIMTLLPICMHAKGRDDPRDGTTAMASIVAAMGHVMTMNHSFYENGLYKAATAELGLATQAPLNVAKGNTTYVQRLKALEGVSVSEVRMLKVAAAHYVAAGTMVAVVWDAVDAKKAGGKGQDLLWAAYVCRVGAGLSTIGAGISAAIWWERARVVLWCTRVTWVSGVITVAASYVIDKLREEEWLVWLEAQPFRLDGSRERPHSSKSVMLSRLSNAIQTMQD